MKTCVLFLACILIGLSTVPAHADPIGLKGSRVRAYFTFLDDPYQDNQFFPFSTRVGAGRDFFFDDGLASYSANFTPDSLTFRVKCDTGISLALCRTDGGFAVLFEDRLFRNATIDVLSNSLGAILIPPSFLPDPRFFGLYFPFTLPSRNSTIVLSIVPAPEPAAIVLFTTGLLGLAGSVRRRVRT